MADQQPSTSNASSDSSESSVVLNIKTLTSQIYTLTADKNMLVSAFKEKIAGQIGLPVEQQRLIFRGKVLKDDLPLSEYHVENGHTLHLVERQPSQPQQPSGSNDGNFSSNNSGRAGLEPGLSGLRNRMGQISHSVVLGTFNVGGEQGEGPIALTDINRVIGAVLNSFGVGNQPGMQPNVQVPQRNGTEEPTEGAGSQTQGVNQPQMGQPFTGQSLPQVMQIPVGASIALPSLNMPIPDSLNTMCEFVSHLEHAMSRHGYSSNESPPDTDNPQTTQLPSSPSGAPTPEALSIVLRRVHHLMDSQATEALSHVAGRLEQEAGSADPSLRGQVMTESVQLGAAMQHLGALLLELGRTMLSMRIGLSPGEFSVNAGPAVYIHPSGPNPIMVQPFPLQTSSIFGGSAAAAPNLGPFGPLGLGSIQRNVNIHIHAGGPVDPGAGAGMNNGVGAQAEPANISSSGQSQSHPTGSSNTAAVPRHPAAVAVSGTVEPTIVAPQDQAVSGTGNSSNRSGEPSQPFSGADQAVSEQHNDEVVGASGSFSSSQAVPRELPSAAGGSSEGTSSSSQGTDNHAGPSSFPLGLGLQGLLAKRQTRQSSSVRRSSSSVNRSASSAGRGVSSRGISRQFSQPNNPGQGVLQSLASARAREENTGGQLDVNNAMSEALHSPALNGLLSGVAQQTGIGSPDALRSIMEQITQNPAMRNTVNQLAQQMDNNNVGDMMASLGGGQGGGFDLSRMIQQMMPIVSQALGGASTAGASSSLSSRAGLNAPSVAGNSQADLHEVARGIEQNSPPEEIFRSVAENAMNQCEGVNGGANVVNEISNVDGLLDEFMEMMQEDIRRRIQDEVASEAEKEL